MDLDELGFRDVSLMEGERIDSALRLGGDGNSGGEPQVMLLTDRRVIHLQGNGKTRKAVFASIQDIDAVEIGAEHEGSSAFIWAALAFIVAIFLYIVIDQSFARIAAPIAVGLMGLYLIVDQFLSSGKPFVVFKAGTSQLQCDLTGDPSASDIYPFINRLFQLKERTDSGGASRPDRFSPR